MEVYFIVHETLGTSSSPDSIDGVPRVICRFGKVVCNIIIILMSFHSLPIACELKNNTGQNGAANVHFETHCFFYVTNDFIYYMLVKFYSFCFVFVNVLYGFVFVMCNVSLGFIYVLYYIYFMWFLYITLFYRIYE